MEQTMEAEKTLSPYFFVQSDDPNIDQLPLKSTDVAVNIAGVIADIKVTQIYTNIGKRPIEAIYVFPASTRAAVYGMKMTIGARTIVAQIKEKQQARQEYEEAKQAGKSASLLEQQRPNVFQMNVANIMPGDEIKVELSYTELLIPEEGVYAFMYPTVVGPRYSNQPEATASATEQWTQNPYLHEGEAPTSIFGITINLATGLPVQEMTCASHKVNINYEGAALANVKLEEAERYGGNRDFILKYRLSGGQIESGLLLYQAEEEKIDRTPVGQENFFLLMVQPPKQVTIDQIPPREYIFILDVSGSMHGFPLNTAKVLLKDLMNNIRPTDVFNILLFSFGSGLLAKQSLPATPDNIRKGIDLIQGQRGGGGTELLPALQRALALPRIENVARTVIIVTDGYVTVETEAFDLIRNNLSKANLFAFGIGSSVNRYLIEGMARVGIGEPFIVTNPNEAPAKAEKLRQYIQSPVLTQISLDFEGFEAYAVEPVSVPDVLSERPVIVFGKWRGQPMGKIVVRGVTGDQPYEKTFVVSDTKPLTTNSALRYLWARHRIAILGDYNNLQKQGELVEEITDLGLTYNLLTAYTSFVAIDSEVRRQGEEATTIKQPLPLPQDVSDYAVGMPGSVSRGAFATMAAPPMMAKMAMPGLVTRGADFLEAVAETPELELEEDLTRQDMPQVTISELTVSDDTQQDMIEKMLQTILKDLGYFYDQVLQKQHITGKIGVTFVVNSSHQAQHIKIVLSELRSKKLEKYLKKQIEGLYFPLPSDSGDVSVSCTFTFTVI